MRHLPSAQSRGPMAKERKVKLSEVFLQSSLARCVLQQNSKLALLCLEQGENPQVRKYLVCL